MWGPRFQLWSQPVWPDPEYPFWRLQNDGIWEIHGGEDFKRKKGNGDPSRTELIEKNIKGGFKIEIYEMLNENRNFLIKTVKKIISDNFPSSLHEKIFQQVGFQIDKKEIIEC